MRKLLVSFIEVVEVALVTVGTVFLVRTFLVQPFLVSGSSMVPTFQNGDYLLVDELTYRFRAPERGEVAVFRYPNNETTYFIKRIIGLPGERITIKDGQIRIFNSANKDGFLLKEEYLGEGARTLGDDDVTLKEDEYFVLGDNRQYSFDSRNWGVLKAREIVGLARIRLWPLNEARAFSAPQY